MPYPLSFHRRRHRKKFVSKKTPHQHGFFKNNVCPKQQGPSFQTDLTKLLFLVTQSIAHSPGTFLLFCSMFLPVALANMQTIVLTDKTSGESIGVNATENFINQISLQVSGYDSSDSSGGTLGGCFLSYANHQSLLFWTNELPVHCGELFEKFSGTILYNFSSLAQETAANCVINYQNTQCGNQRADDAGFEALLIMGSVAILFTTILIVGCFCGDSIKNAIRHIGEILQNLYNQLKQAVQECGRVLSSFRVSNVERQRLNTDSVFNNYGTTDLECKL